MQEPKAALEAAGVENPMDMERIRFALQGCNYWSGYITWVLRKYVFAILDMTGYNVVSDI